MRTNYFKFMCPECGAPLEVYSEYIVSVKCIDKDELSHLEVDLIRHCKNCLCDWENKHFESYGYITESQLERKFWG